MSIHLGTSTFIRFFLLMLDTNASPPHQLKQKRYDVTLQTLPYSVHLAGYVHICHLPWKSSVIQAWYLTVQYITSFHREWRDCSVTGPNTYTYRGWIYDLSDTRQDIKRSYKTEYKPLFLDCLISSTNKQLAICTTQSSSWAGRKKAWADAPRPGQDTKRPGTDPPVLGRTSKGLGQISP